MIFICQLMTYWRTIWRGGRVVYRVRLEIGSRFTATGGSNPLLSVILSLCIRVGWGTQNFSFGDRYSCLLQGDRAC